METTRSNLKLFLAQDPELQRRYQRVRNFSKTIRTSEYYLTNACNIRCKGCWFFSADMDKASRDEGDPDKVRAFLKLQRERGINSALIIGGEPTLFPDKLAIFTEALPYVSISSNGLKKLPVENFENVTIGLSVFGGGPLDDELRAIRAGGQRFQGLFDTALKHYTNDPRVIVNYAVTEPGLGFVDETVRRIRDNGNIVMFNYYSSYNGQLGVKGAQSERLIEELLRVTDKYPDTVVSRPYYTEALVRGRTSWGKFGYESCPSVSVDHPANAARLSNGHPSLPLFNAYASDLATINQCCTSGQCDDCRDSQAFVSWLMVNVRQFMGNARDFRTWLEICENYWATFIWSPFHRAHRAVRNSA